MDRLHEITRCKRSGLLAHIQDGSLPGVPTFLVALLRASLPPHHAGSSILREAVTVDSSAGVVYSATIELRRRCQAITSHCKE